MTKETCGKKFSGAPSVMTRPFFNLKNARMASWKINPAVAAIR
jgi:hypothetical protein